MVLLPVNFSWLSRRRIPAHCIAVFTRKHIAQVRNAQQNVSDALTTKNFIEQYVEFCRCDYNKYTLRVLLDKADRQKEQSSGKDRDAENEESDDDMLLIRSDENEKADFSDENEENTDDDSEENDEV